MHIINMTPKIAINGPYRYRKRPRARLLEGKAYLVFAAMGIAVYFLYMLIAG